VGINLAIVFAQKGIFIAAMYAPIVTG